MSVKINFNQPQEQCLIDLFNHHNAARIGFDILAEDVVFGTPTIGDTGSDRDTVVTMRTNGSTKIKGSTKLRYNRLDMGQMPVPENALMITLTSNHNSTQSLVPNLNAILGIQLKESDLIYESIVPKQLPYGLNEKYLVVADECLVFRGRFKVKLIREEPLSLSRPPVKFQAINLVVKNPAGYRTLSEWLETWRNSKLIGSENDTLKPTTAFLPDRYDVETEEVVSGAIDKESPLYLWYKLYPEDAPRGE